MFEMIDGPHLQESELIEVVMKLVYVHDFAHRTIPKYIDEHCETNMKFTTAQNIKFAGQAVRHGCRVKYKDYIVMNARYVALVPIGRSLSTVVHEIAHLSVGVEHLHDEKFIDEYKRIASIEGVNFGGVKADLNLNSDLKKLFRYCRPINRFGDVDCSCIKRVGYVESETYQKFDNLAKAAVDIFSKIRTNGDYE